MFFGRSASSLSEICSHISDKISNQADTQTNAIAPSYSRPAFEWHRIICQKYIMSLPRLQKLRSLLDAWEPHSVATTAYLKTLGISPQDLQNYTSSRWLTPLGRGAFKRPMETVTWRGALYSLQGQLRLPVHVGALTALEMSGHSHYVRFGKTKAYLFSPLNVALPLWFRTHWRDDVRHVQTKLLPPDVGLTEQRGSERFALRTSTAERAVLELLHLAPKTFGLVEAGMIVEGMTLVRPKDCWSNALRSRCAGFSSTRRPRRIC